MDEIKALIDKYMDGETTNAEEQLLRDYFRTLADTLPAEWKPLGALFRFVDKEQHAPVVSIRQKVRRTWLAVASVAAVLLLVALPFIKGNSHTAYAVIDGQRTTNQEVVMQEAEAALQQVAIDEEDAFGALEEMTWE